ncbi:multiple sugar transport system permease protein [Frigoribacterium sp. PvP120]|jgi:multiple sugar transport system permease protein|uniref:carbohydrate ABC transporter permease n=1 Tax=Frigoribacterium TaxID=96492 RepID=UPI0009EC4325|nr:MULTISPECIES: sugar ABC transporter permease [Frigoribacterium]MBD8658875.1 sugar ABC transporter permease [Frigoribacterium sp. CFBP 8754]MBD8727170.1 sugar ABC transporter permease [Frigoribacterium sp. CFBP 13707]MBP1241176.1 multiple sugar transport system permease protein [Frigoribacterium sp. PvP121]NII50055.1 multiple sugar transport system permease protein [Frigoribacterium endophyticum]QNE44693.1 sugar ABC transporter permease [Frigoribacterium sp. NBH87]
MTVNLLPPAPAEEATPPDRHQAAPLQPAQKRKAHRSPLAYFLVAPAALAELLVHIIPMVLGVWIAFITLNQLSIANWVNAPFVGLRNFVTALDPSSPIAGQLYGALGRTLLFTVIVVAIAWSMGMLGAVLLTSSFKGRGILRTLFLVPYALPSYVGTIAWAFMFNQRDGAINRFLVDDLGILQDRPFWLLGGNSFWAIVIVTAWQFWPFAFLMLLAALQNIPGDVYEAASLDGASLWKQFTQITLPMVKPANAVLLLIMSLWIFNQFNVPYVLFGPASPEQATLISPLIYQQSFNNWNFGLGGAMSVMLLIVLLIASAFYIRMVLPKGQHDD